MPIEDKYESHTYHTFIIQVENRNKLKNYLLKNGIETSIHYPISINQQKPSKEKKLNTDTPLSNNQSKRILSLPIHQYLSENDIICCNKIKKFYKN